MQRQAGRQHRVLKIEQPGIAALQAALLGQPAFGPRIGGVDADIDDFRLLQTPIAHDAEALAVPVRIGDQVDCDMDAERAREFQGLEIAAERHALAIFFEPVLIDRFEPEKHVGDPELFPEPEHLLVPQQDVAAGFEVIALFDAAPRDGFAELRAMPLMHKGDIVDDENSRLADLPQILDDALRAQQAIAAPVKGPGAAERAVPRTAAREFDRGARVENADKIFSPVPQQIARRQQLIERMHKAGRRTLAGRLNHARHGREIGPGLDRRQERPHAGLALAAQHAVDRAFAMVEDRLGDKGGAVAADADDDARQPGFSLLREIDDFRDVSEVIAREGDEVRPPRFDKAEECAVALDLQIDKLDLVTALARRRGDQLQPQWLEAQENLRVHQRAGMDRKASHGNSPVSAMSRHETTAPDARSRRSRQRFWIRASTGAWCYR